MPTTQAQAKAMEEADSRMTLTGALSPRNTSQDAEWWERLTKRSLQAGSMTSEAYSAPQPSEDQPPEN